ncbi:MAG: LolA family protein [Thermodesulfobacteriota bacterium]
MRIPGIGLLAGLVCLALLGWPAVGMAGDLAPLEVAKRLQSQYETTKSMAADFQQTTSMPGAGRKRFGSGRVVILKPGRIRWDYETPDVQVLITDGKKAHLYFAASAQMIVRPVAEYLNSDITYSFFAGSGDIVRDFEVSPPERPDGAGLVAIKLTPKKPHPQVAMLHVWVDRDFVLQRLEIVDHFGSITDLVFSNIRKNQPVSGDTFRFTPPAGTEIIEQ